MKSEFPGVRCQVPGVKIWIFACLVSMFCVSLTQPAEALMVSCSPGRVDLSGGPQSNLVKTLGLENHHDEEVTTRLSLSPMYVDKNGQTFSEPPQGKYFQVRSAAEWLSLSNEFISFTGVQHVDLQLSGQIPPDTKPGNYYALLTITSARTNEFLSKQTAGYASFGIIPNIGLVVPVTVHVAGPTVELELEPVALKININKTTLNSLLSVINRSTDELRIKGNINLFRESNGKREAKAFFTQALGGDQGERVYPDVSRDIAFSTILPRLDANYVLQYELRYGDNKVYLAEKKFKVKYQNNELLLIENP